MQELEKGQVVQKPERQASSCLSDPPRSCCILCLPSGLSSEAYPTYDSQTAADSLWSVSPHSGACFRTVNLRSRAACSLWFEGLYSALSLEAEEKDASNQEAIARRMNGSDRD